MHHTHLGSSWHYLNNSVSVEELNSLVQDWRKWLFWVKNDFFRSKVPKFLHVVSNVIGKHCPVFVFLVFFARCTKQSGKFTHSKTGSGNEFPHLCCDVSLRLHYFGAQDNVKLSIRQVETSPVAWSPLIWHIFAPAWRWKDFIKSGNL